MESLNIKPKDIIQYALYLISFIIFIVTMDNKIDKIGEKLSEMKIEKKEFSLEQNQTLKVMQSQLNVLGVTAELNKQNISINKADIIILNLKIDRLLDK